MVRAGRQIYQAMVIGGAAAIATALLLASPWGWAMEQRFGLTWLFMLRGPVAPPPEVVLIAIDKASSDALGVPYDTSRWPRSLHTRLVEGLTAAGARAITFDLHFKLPHVDHDPALADALRKAGNVALLEFLDKQQPVDVEHDGTRLPVVVQQRSPPAPAIAQAAGGLGPFTLPKVPDSVASFWTFDENAGSVPALPLVSLALFAQADYAALIRRGAEDAAAGAPSSLLSVISSASPSQARAALQRSLRSAGDMRPAPPVGTLDSMLAALAPPTSRYFNYYGPAHTIPTVFYNDALALLARPAGRERFADKAVFVGVSSPVQWQLRDEFRTAYSDPETGLDLSGSEILATAFANLLDVSSIRPLGFTWSVPVLLVWGALSGLLLRLLRASIALPLLGLMAAAYIAMTVTLFSTQYLWLPLFMPLVVMTPLIVLASLLWQNRLAHRDLERIQQTFGHYLPPSTMRRLVEQGYRTLDDRRTVYGVCLMTDAQGYTAVAEHMPSHELVDLVNDYLGVIIEQVAAFGGEVSDIKGDAVMAFWASRLDAHALRTAACRAVLAIDRATADWNKGNRFGVSLPTRIGMHCGAMTLARVGAADHYEHRAVGDIVNTASRLEQLSKRLGSRLLVSEGVVEGVDDVVTRRLGSFSLPGRRDPLVVHELLGRSADVRHVWAEVLPHFDAGVAAYEAGDRIAAQKAFADALALRKDDTVTRWFIAQIDTMT